MDSSALLSPEFSTVKLLGEKFVLKGCFHMMAKDLVFLFLLTLACAKKTVIEKSEGIFILNEKNYDKAVKEFDHLLVYFYAPWLVTSFNLTLFSYRQSFHVPQSS